MYFSSQKQKEENPIDAWQGINIEVMGLPVGYGLHLVTAGMKSSLLLACESKECLNI